MTDTTSIVEKVSRAIYRATAGCESNGAHLSDANMDIARAAIEAMLEPTQAMGWAGARAIQGPVGGSAFDAANECHRAMIDAALTQQDVS